VSILGIAKWLDAYNFTFQVGMPLHVLAYDIKNLSALMTVISWVGTRKGNGSFLATTAKLDFSFLDPRSERMN
jgi:hypothetical protein